MLCKLLQPSIVAIFPPVKQSVILFLYWSIWQRCTGVRHPKATLTIYPVLHSSQCRYRWAQFQQQILSVPYWSRLNQMKQECVQILLFFHIGWFVTQIQSGALDVLSSRLHNVTDTIRRVATMAINNIVDLIHKIISSTPEEGLMISALMALRTISLTMCPGEESSLVNTIPSVLAAIQGRKALGAAMTTLPPMV